jgi:hypothetical protein
MYSVTQRIKQTKQPYGGYINPKQFRIVHREDNITLHPVENIHASVVGSAVDYLSRFMSGTPVNLAFIIPMVGAFGVNETAHCQSLLETVTGLDNNSIIAACQLTGYDVVKRAGKSYYKPVSKIQPDAETVENIRTMVNRSLAFIEEYGPIIKDGFTFGGGYTEIISSGDGDFLTADTLWEYKVLSSAPTSRHTLQLLIYYLMGIHSVHPEFKSIQRLGIFNPRMNNIYLLNIDSIPTEVIQKVSSDVIGYK